jgi:peptidoglycan/LPS O-acetylase OafA/YrhL
MSTEVPTRAPSNPEAPTKTAATETAAADTAAPAKRYLHQIDLFRLLTFACVILVHVVSGTNAQQSVPSNALQELLHFTREAFFALTGFVLVYQYGRRKLTVSTFWLRRFQLVGIPYVVWSVFFWGYALSTGPHESASTAVGHLLLELVEGTAWYHLYFLLVTMQVYLLFPLLMKLLRATEGHHRWLLLASGAVQLCVVYLITYPPVNGPVTGEVYARLFATIVPYQFYTVLGAVAAFHFQAVHSWVRRHGRLIGVGFVVVGIATLGAYFLNIHLGTSPLAASSVFEPYMMPWFLAIITGMYALGSRWAARRTDHQRFAKVIRYASDRSFGIFLVHPLGLVIMDNTVAALRASVGQPWTTILVYLGTVTITVAIVEVLRRVPGSLALTGRPMLRGTRIVN